MSWRSLRRYVMGMGALFGWLVLPLVTLAQTTGSNTQVRLSVPIGSMSSVAAEGGLAQYIVGVYGYMLGIVTIVAVIMVMYGGFRYLLGSTYGDVKTGKDIILDALGGMVVLFLAYFILYNVNPKTVTLQVPGLTRIRSVALSGPAQRPPPPPTTNVCGSPGSNAAYRRSAALPSAGRSPGQPCGYDSECQSGICFMENQTQGKCSDLSLGQRCKCVGQCCGMMTNSNQVDTYLSDTNNRGTGVANCQTGLTCSHVDNDWKCARLSVGSEVGQIRTGAPTRPSMPRPDCRTDSDCSSLGSGAACIYNSRLTDSLTGRTECSLGREGDQCRCSGTGCDLTAPPSFRTTGGQQLNIGNNGGRKEIACGQGLECVGYLRPSGSIQDPRDIEYFCTAIASRSGGAATEAMNGRCDFSCANASTERMTAGVCNPGDVTEADRQCFSVCQTQCQTRGSLCQARVNGANNIRCLSQ